MRRTPQVGNVVEVRFSDHCEDGDPIECTVWGRLSKKTREFFEVKVWEADNEKHNEKVFSIVRKAVIHAKVLR